MQTIAVVLIGASVLLGPAQNRADDSPFTIQIRADVATVRLGSPVDIGIVLKNTSAQPLDCSANISSLTGQDPYLSFDVRDERGNLTPKRVYPHPELAEGHPILDCTIKPGETRTEGQDITQIYNLSAPGKYTVQVSRAISPTSEKDLVKSNKITVTVTRSAGLAQSASSAIPLNPQVAKLIDKPLVALHAALFR